MKIELNKTYRTRNGFRATVTAFDNTALRPFIATISGDGPDHSRNYTESGHEHQPIGGEPREASPYDIVALLTPDS